MKLTAKIPPYSSVDAAGVERAWELLAQRLHYIMERMDPSDGNPSWAELDEMDKGFYRSCIKELLVHERRLVTLALSAAGPSEAEIVERARVLDKMLRKSRYFRGIGSHNCVEMADLLDECRAALSGAPGTGGADHRDAFERGISMAMRASESSTKDNPDD